MKVVYVVSCLCCGPTGAVKRCFKCRSRGELGDCRNPDESRSLVSTARDPFSNNRDQTTIQRNNPNAFGANFESSSSWSGVEAVPCSSGWCAKVIEGKGTFKAEGKWFVFHFDIVNDTPNSHCWLRVIAEYGTATERMCLQRPPQDLGERCAMTVRGNQEVYMCFCQGDLCNGQPAFTAPHRLIAGLLLSTLLVWRVALWKNSPCNTWFKKKTNIYLHFNFVDKERTKWIDKFFVLNTFEIFFQGKLHLYFDYEMRSKLGERRKMNFRGKNLWKMWEAILSTGQKIDGGQKLSAHPFFWRAEENYYCRR